MNRIFSKFKALPLWMSPLRKWRTKATECEIIFAIYISDKTLVSNKHTSVRKQWYYRQRFHPINTLMSINPY